MDSPLLVSVIIPVHNGENLIAGCIESLCDQDYPKDRYEIIVVNNASTDNTEEVVRKFNDVPGLFYLYEPIRGSYKARNAGIKQAKGNIIAFTDADCITDRQWLKRGVEGFEGANIGCVAGEIEGYKPNNYIEQYLIDKKELSQGKTLDEAFMSYAKTANVFYGKTVFGKIGPFEEKWISGGDADLSWRMQIETDYKIKYIPEALVYHKHRTTIGSMFKQCTKWGIGSVLLYKKYKPEIKNRTFRKKIWIFLRMLKLIFTIIPFLVSKNKKDWPKEIRNKHLDYISFLGWEIGRIIGSVKSGVFYL